MTNAEVLRTFTCMETQTDKLKGKNGDLDLICKIKKTLAPREEESAIKA